MYPDKNSEIRYRVCQAVLLPCNRGSTRFYLIIILLLLLFFFFFSFVSESPTWLLQKGKPKDANKVLKKIATVNRIEIKNTGDIFHVRFFILLFSRHFSLQNASLWKAYAIGAGGLGFDSQAGKIVTVSPTARHRCDVSSELCCPGAKPRRWAPSLDTRFGVIPRV